MTVLPPLRHIDAGVLNIAHVDAGPCDGPPVVLMHGFPYDIHAYAAVLPPLVAAGCRVVVPYVRGFGPTRFLHADTPRSGEQAALGADLLALMDALQYNPDFVDVVIHSYRHRFGLVPGDPALAGIEARLAQQPAITVPTLTFDGADDGVRPPAKAAQHGHRFTGPREHAVVPGVGHNMPQEVPAVFADAVLRLVRGELR